MPVSASIMILYVPLDLSSKNIMRHDGRYHPPNGVDFEVDVLDKQCSGTPDAVHRGVVSLPSEAREEASCNSSFKYSTTDSAVHSIILQVYTVMPSSAEQCLLFNVVDASCSGLDSLTVGSSGDSHALMLKRYSD